MFNFKTPPLRLECSLLKGAPSIIHGFFTRQGGVSQAPFDSLNIGLNKGDQESCVHTNRSRIAQSLGFDACQLFVPRQNHTNQVHILTDPWEPLYPPVADALVTSRQGTLIGVQTADCVPILLWDPLKKIIAAVHSGWKGTLLNIIESTIITMQSIGSITSHIKAAIGPCIGPSSFEIGEDLIKKPEFSSFILPHPYKKNKAFLDLRAIIIDQLKNMGVFEIDVAPYDTYQEKDLFFSCRRSFHKKETLYGCQMSMIGIHFS